MVLFQKGTCILFALVWSLYQLTWAPSGWADDVTIKPEPDLQEFFDTESACDGVLVDQFRQEHDGDASRGAPQDSFLPKPSLFNAQTFNRCVTFQNLTPVRTGIHVLKYKNQRQLIVKDSGWGGISIRLLLILPKNRHSAKETRYWYQTALRLLEDIPTLTRPNSTVRTLSEESRPLLKEALASRRPLVIGQWFSDGKKISNSCSLLRVGKVNATTSYMELLLSYGPL